uniref:Peptidase_S8 domain-containing protein n=1 Tax=Macrostomum lignano TaxID=282301 RepID=A0A1I8HW38_9PLAT
MNDEKWSKMWYLQEPQSPRRRHPGGVPAPSMNIAGAWRLGYHGQGVVVSVLDDGIDMEHPDLRENYDSRASFDVNGNDPDPTYRPTAKDENKHGTRCAGQIAAQANNSICIPGVAFRSRIGAIRMLDGEITDTVETLSLGTSDDGATLEGPGRLTQKAFSLGVARGRQGLGSVFVWASGNGGREDNCNTDGYTNSIYTLSVGAVSESGTVPWYSESCSSTLAATYSRLGLVKAGEGGLHPLFATGSRRPPPLTLFHKSTQGTRPRVCSRQTLGLLDRLGSDAGDPSTMASSASLTPAEAGAPATPAGDSGTSAAPPGADGLAAGSAGDMPARATGPSAEARRTRNQRRNERRRRLRGTAGRPPAEGEPREGEAAVGPKGTTATPAPQDTTPAGEPPSIPATSAAGPSGTAATNYASKVKLQPAVIVFGEEQDLTADELDSAWRTIDAALIDQLLAGRPVSVVKSAKTDGCIFIWCSSEESSRNLRELLPKLNWPKKLGKLVFASEGERQKTQRFRVWIPAGSAIKSGDQLRQILLKLHPDLKVNGLLHHATSRKEKGATVILGLSDDWAKRLPPKSTIHIGLTQLTILRCEERKADEAKNAKASETGTGAQAPPAKKPRQTADPMPGKAVRAAETGNRNRRPARSTRRSGLIQRALDQAKNLRAHRERARASRAPPQQPEGQTLSGEAPTDWFESVTHQEAGATRIDLTDEAEGTGSDSTEARRRGDGNVHAGLTSAEDSTATLTAEDAETPMEVCGSPTTEKEEDDLLNDSPTATASQPRSTLCVTPSSTSRGSSSSRNPGLSESIGAWRVLPVSSLSDHKFISFNLMAARSATRVMWRRNARNTDWETFGLALKEFHRSPGQPSTITSCREADECATVLTETLTAAFEASCPLKAYKGKKSAPWWNPELGNLRRRAKRLHRRATKTKSPADQTAYHEAIHEFKRQVRNAKAQKWRQYCEELEGSRPTSRVVKALTLDKMSKLSSVKRTDGKRLRLPRRLADAGIRIQPHRAMAKRKLLPHADLCLKDLRDSGGLHVLSDGEPRTLNLFQRYKVTIPSRDAANDHWNFQEVHCYTDGSIKDGRAGFGIDDWADSLHRDRWAGTQNCRQSRAAVPCPSHRLRNILLNQNRKDIRALVMTLTGHGYLARHCFLRGDLESEICPFCECDNEDAQHFVCHCPFFNRDRLRYLGPNPSIDEVCQPDSIPRLIQFLRATRRASFFPTEDHAAGRTGGPP